MKESVIAMNTPINHLTAGFIGLGLIGGSIAKAIRAAYPGCFIRACDTDPATLKLALAEGTADEITDHKIGRAHV